MSRRPTIKTVDRGKSYDRRKFKIYEEVSEDEDLTDVSDDDDTIEDVKRENQKLKRKLRRCREKVKKELKF